MASVYDSIYGQSPYQLNVYSKPIRSAQKRWYDMTDMEKMGELRKQQGKLQGLQQIPYGGEERRKDFSLREAFEPASLNIYPEELKNKRREQLGTLYQNATTEWQEKYAPMIPNIIQADFEEVKNMMTQLDMGSLPIKENKWDTMSDEAQTALLTRYMKSQIGERYLKLATAVGITEADVKLTFSWDYFPGKIDWDTWANEAQATSLLESGRGTGLGEIERMPQFTGNLGLGETRKQGAGLGGVYGLNTENLFGRQQWQVFTIQFISSHRINSMFTASP